MFFQPLPTRHPVVVRSSLLPPDLQDYQIEGAETKYFIGEFGRMIGQLIPTDEYTVTLHHLLLDKSVHLSFPFQTFQPILLFNHSVPIPLRVNIGNERVPMGRGDIEQNAFHAIDGLQDHCSLIIQKGRYSFFLVDGRKMNFQTVFGNDVLRNTFFKHMKEYLIGIAGKTPSFL